MPDKLCFYSRSRDAYPGRGTGEQVTNTQDYNVLSQIPHWRQVLSNFSDDCVFEYEGLTYRTVEHAFQAAKIRMVDEEIADQFALESHSPLSEGSGAHAQKHRKMCTLNTQQLAIWDACKMQVLTSIWGHKAEQCPLFRQVLLATRYAELWHFQSRKPAIRWEGLEEVRANLQG